MTISSAPSGDPARRVPDNCEERHDQRASVDVPLSRVRFGQSARKDTWWLPPLITFVVFPSFVVYVTWALLIFPLAFRMTC